MDSNVKILKKIETLLEEKPELFANFCIFLDASESVDLEKLVDQVDESDYSLADWIESLLAFDEWLNRGNLKKRDFGNMLGYLHCCTFVIPESVDSPCLKAVLQQCLSDHGYDASGES